MIPTIVHMSDMREQGILNREGGCSQLGTLFTWRL